MAPDPEGAYEDMPDLDRSRSIPGTIVGLLTLGVGLATFATPLHHPGPYGIPGRGLVGGALCLCITLILLTRGAPMWARRTALVASPFVLFVALYATLAELEEVVVLRTPETGLRLWVVDYDGVAWVSMGSSKAERYGIDGAQLELSRGGEVSCVTPRIVDDLAANRRTFDLRQEKYAVQRLAVALGLFGDGPGPDTITLRLDPCD